MAGTILTLERKRIDRHRLYGVVVAESDQLMLLHQNDDFQFDGYVVVRKKDITKSLTSEGTDHCIAIMKKEGLWEPVPRSVKRLPVDSWGSLLNRFVGKVVILEAEWTDDFYIGPVLEVQKNAVVIDYIDCCGKRMGEEKISFRRITQVRFGGRYETMHEKYMEKE
jgi:hypothetical protein